MMGPSMDVAAPTTNRMDPMIKHDAIQKVIVFSHLHSEPR